MPIPNPSPAGPRGRRGKPDRFHRFTSARVDNVALEEKDHELLRLVERCRLVDSRQLRLTIGRRWTNERAFLHRLARLFHGEFLNRPPSQLNRWWTKGQPTKHYVYGLGAKGYAALYPNDAGDESTAVLRLKDRRIGSAYIDHRLRLTEAVLCLEEAARAEGWRLAWSEGDGFRAQTKLPRYVRITSTERPQPLSPDAYLKLMADEVTAHFFLEVDNGTEPVERRGDHRWERSSILRKLAVYDEIAPRKSDGDRDRRRAPFPFRVLTVTTTAERMDSMRALAREMDPKKKGARIFLFTTHERVNLARPGDLLAEAVWWTPNDADQPLALID